MVGGVLPVSAFDGRLRAAQSYRLGLPVPILAQADGAIPPEPYSPTRTSAWFTRRSDSRSPARMSTSTTGRAAGIRPRCFAIKTSPSVPRSGTPSVIAQRRAARSSMIASEPGWARHQERTADSPGPRSQRWTVGGGGDGSMTRSQGVRARTRAVGSSSPRRRISATTGPGTTISGAES